jgi:hypothetical protein
MTISVSIAVNVTSWTFPLTTAPAGAGMVLQPLAPKMAASPNVAVSTRNLCIVASLYDCILWKKDAAPDKRGELTPLPLFIDKRPVDYLPNLEEKIQRKNFGYAFN